MDVYLPDEFYALSESPNANRARTDAALDEPWFGGEAFVAREVRLPARDRSTSEPDPIWRVI